MVNFSHKQILFHLKIPILKSVRNHAINAPKNTINVINTNRDNIESNEIHNKRDRTSYNIVVIIITQGKEKEGPFPRTHKIHQWIEQKGSYYRGLKVNLHHLMGQPHLLPL